MAPMEDLEREFLGRVSRALDHRKAPPFDVPSREDTPPDQVRTVLNRISRRRSKQRGELLDRLMTEARLINLDIRPVDSLDAAADAIGDIAVRCRPHISPKQGVVAWRHPLLDQLPLGQLFEGLGIPFDRAVLQEPALASLPEPDRRTRIRQQIGSAFLGITSADVCVAQSATLALRTRSGQPRAVSLAPDVHVAVIELKQIVADFEELYTLFKWHPTWRKEGLGPSFYFITGPSKTADIELQLVYGVHGPRQVHILVLTGGTEPRKAGSKAGDPATLKTASKRRRAKGPKEAGSHAKRAD